MAAPMLSAFLVGLCVRLWMVRSFLADWLSEKNEFSTPMTSWKRVTEGVKLYQKGISPYSGDLFHETPLLLRFFSYLDKRWTNFEPIVFVLLDVFTALVLERIAKYLVLYFAFKQKKQKKNYADGTENIQIDMEKLQWSRIQVVIIYLLNPYSVAACLAKSTAVFNNLAIALSVFYMLKGNRIMCTFFLALAAYQSLYPIMMLVPITLYLIQMGVSQNSWSNRQTAFSMFLTVFWFSVWSAFLLLYSYWSMGDWQFIQSTYGFILTVPDLSPNIGLFWYFFTEMFEHFRMFFLIVFQIHVFIYTVPLAIKLRDHPICMMYIQLILISIFKSYPSYGDTLIYLSLLPVWSFLFSYLRNTFLISCMFVCSTVFGPIMYHLWLYSGSANANFYFAITLVYCTAQIFLITDFLFAFLRREYDLHMGLKPVVNGKEAMVILKD